MSEYVWMSSNAAAVGSALAGSPPRLAPRQCQDRPDALAAGEQRVAHRLDEALGSGVGFELHREEVLLDHREQVCRIRSPSISSGMAVEGCS